MRAPSPSLLHHVGFLSPPAPHTSASAPCNSPAHLPTANFSHPFPVWKMLTHVLRPSSFSVCTVGMSLSSPTRRNELFLLVFLSQRSVHTSFVPLVLSVSLPTPLLILLSSLPRVCLCVCVCMCISLYTHIYMYTF